MENVMNPCKDCIVDMICTTKCPLFEINMERLQTDEVVYLNRCMNNSKNETTYNLSENVEVIISVYSIYWYKDNKIHRSNDQPAIIYYTGSRVWYKNGNRHRDNDQPAIIFYGGIREWYKNGVYYEPM